MSDVKHDLRKEAEAAQVLVATLRDLDSGDDEELRRDTIEGETGLLEAIDAALEQAAEDLAFVAALKMRKEQIDKRISRLENRADMTKAAIATAMGMADLRTLKRPLTPLSIRPTQPKVIVTSEADIPSQYWKPQEPKLDRAGLLKALKDEQTIPGAELSNGGETLAWSLK